VAWRSGTVVTQTGSEGGFSSTRVATAPDHVGVVAWNAGSGQIRVAAVGPDAPVDPVSTIPPSWPPGTTAPATKPKPRITAKGSARRAGRKVRVRITGRLLLPAGVSRATGCNGKVKVTIKRGRKVVGSKTLRVRSTCAFALRGTLQRSKVKRAKRLVVTLLFRGNAVLSPARKAGSLKLKG
jgi:hypothetical protein